MTKTLISLASLGLALTFISGCSSVQADVVDKTFDVDSGGTLYVDSDSGSISVESHSSNTVEVEVEKSGKNADDFIVTFDQKGDDVYVEGDQEGMFTWRSAQVRYVIKVPENYNVELETGGGSISLSDLKGEVNAKTSGGSIQLGEIEGDVKVRTSGGSISVDEVAGNIDAHTSGGSVKATLSKQPTADCRLTTSGGSVTAYLAKNVAVDIDASTSGGRVRSEFDVDGKVKKTSIRGEINGGGPELKLKTSGGSVNIKEI